MSSFSNNLPEPRPESSLSPAGEHEHSNPYSTKSFIKDVLLGPTVKSDPLHPAEVEPQKKEKKAMEKPGDFSVLRRDLKRELEKYDPYINVGDKVARGNMEKEIVSKRMKEINSKEAGKFLKKLKTEHETKRFSLFRKVWNRLQNTK